MQTTNEREQSARPQPQGPRYVKPVLVSVGDARRLILGASGKHTDGYSGWYWNGEG